MNNDRLNQQIKLAKEVLRQGDRRSASEISRRIIDQLPKRLEAWLILGGLSKPEMRWHYLRQKSPWTESQQAAGHHEDQGERRGPIVS